MVLSVPVYLGAAYLSCLNISILSAFQFLAHPPSTFNTFTFVETWCSFIPASLQEQPVFLQTSPWIFINLCKPQRRDVGISNMVDLTIPFSGDVQFEYQLMEGTELSFFF